MKFLVKFLKLLFLLSLLGGLAGAGGLAVIYLRLQPELPSIDALKDVRLQVPLRVHSRDGRLIAEYGEKRRIPLAYDEIPPMVRQAFLAAEDDRFFEHPGVDYQGLVRAGVQFALTGKRRQGGSTITMQVARNFFLTREKTFTRKIKEIFLALRIERDLSKEEILELYLNKIYLGQRAYGIGAAAQVYYGQDVDALTLPQIAMLAGLPKAPSTTNPVTAPERAVLRRNYVLGRMAELDFIDGAALEAARNAPVTARLHRAAAELEAPYVAEMVRADAVERYGEEAYTRGITVYTTLDGRLQAAANHALRSALQAYDVRHGYRGAVAHKTLENGQDRALRRDWLKELPRVAELTPALVLTTADKGATVLLPEGEPQELTWKGLKWARAYRSENRRGPAPKSAADILSPGDLIYLYRETEQVKGKKGGEAEQRFHWRLAQVPAVEGALVSLDPDDGAVLALVGGYDFYRSKFNRVVQARRQPGSGFKAFIYSAALEAGFTPASLINDAPLVVQDASLEGDWRPENYSGKWFGPTRLRVALYKSRNLVSIRLLRAMGVEHALAHAARFGFDPDKLPHNLSLALGSGEVTPLQMARGYSVLANGGYLVDPYFIERIEDGHDGILFQAAPRRVCADCPEPPADAGQAAATVTAAEAAPVADTAPRVLNAQNQYLMTSMMQDVIRRGTGVRARVLGRGDLAGKTGTTNDQRDAWFNGFNRKRVAIAWVGFDDYRPLGRGEVGGKAALPAWIDFMRVALDGMPEQGWVEPEGIVSARIDPVTGLRVGTEREDAVFELFREDNVPAEETAAAAGPASGGATLGQDLF